MSDQCRENYIHASALYEQILESNINQLISDLSDSDRLAFREQGQENDEEIRSFFRTVHHLNGKQDKSQSRLFQRLLDGKLPLPIAPPVSFSYPWYDVVEGPGPWPVSISRQTKSVTELICHGIDFNTAQRFTGIQINHCMWRLLERKSPTCALITYGSWSSLGYTWLLRRTAILASESSSPIVGVRNERFSGKVKSIDELRLYQLGKAEVFFGCLRWAKDASLAQNYIDAQRAISMECERSADRDVKAGIALLVERRHAGLPDTPSREEVLALADQFVSSVLRDGYFVREEDGILMTHEWLLSRQTP